MLIQTNLEIYQMILSKTSLSFKYHPMQTIEPCFEQTNIGAFFSHLIWLVREINILQFTQSANVFPLTPICSVTVICMMPATIVLVFIFSLTKTCSTTLHIIVVSIIFFLVIVVVAYEVSHIFESHLIHRTSNAISFEAHRRNHHFQVSIQN